MTDTTRWFFDKRAEQVKLTDMAGWFRQYSLIQMFGPAAKDWDPGPVPDKVSASRENGRQTLRDVGYSEMEARWIEHANWEWDWRTR